MTRADIICKDLNVIYQNIRDSLFDSYEYGQIDGYEQGKEDATDERASLLAFICEKYHIPLIDMNCTVNEWILKKQK